MTGFTHASTHVDEAAHELDASGAHAADVEPSRKVGLCRRNGRQDLVHTGEDRQRSHETGPVFYIAGHWMNSRASTSRTAPSTTTTVAAVVLFVSFVCARTTRGSRITASGVFFQAEDGIRDA